MHNRVVVLLLVVAATALVATLIWRAWFVDPFELPARLRGEEILQDLSGTLARENVLQEPSPSSVRLGWIQPGPVWNADGGYRRAIIAPPPSLVRYRIRAPAQTALSLAVGVQSTAGHDGKLAGVRFVVSLNGREVFSRILNPAATKHDRRWLEAKVDLEAAAERDVEITLRTEPERAGSPIAGLPGWADLRIVRETRRERQLAGPGAPNVLVILVDTLRSDALGCYGARPSPSPTLDRLAHQGILFENAVAQSSWTMPSVATIMTGLHPRDHGLVGWAAGSLSNMVPTLAALATRAGITTIGVSANPLVSRRTNLARGFETFVDYAPNEKDKGWATAADVTGPFLRWLERNRGLRFLAYLHYMEPHDPYTPPLALSPRPPDGVRPQIAAGSIYKYAHRIGRRKTPPPLQPPEVMHLRALYDAEVRAWDVALGELLTALTDLGLRDSTVLIVTSDHGEEFMEHGRLKHGSQLYEESIRVPLVISGPSLIPDRVAEQVQGIDLFPTIARLLGVPLPPNLPGRDLLGARTQRPAFCETDHGIASDGSGMRLVSVRKDNWKLIHTPALGRFELYDLGTDPGERENRLGTTTEGNSLRKLLADWERVAPPPPEPAALDPTVREHLRALGYVQ